MLEKMAEFFERRLDGYDQHMKNNIEGAKDFYPFTAAELPRKADSNILDLGCGTGLELEEYFKLVPTASITCIDLSEQMLHTLQNKFKGKNITPVIGSYFTLPFGVGEFDAAVSVESLHHFTRYEKTVLYKKLVNSLRNGGYFILTDYFALSNEEEQLHLSELEKLKNMQGITDDELYHYDTPLTVENEICTLTDAGFSHIDILKNWGATYTLKATK